MAEIEKGLPNTRTKLEIPSEEEMTEVSVKEEEVEKGPVEVVPEEDGGATIDFEPGAINIPGTENHFDNLYQPSNRFGSGSQQRPILYPEGRNTLAGGGIAKQAGVDSGPPPDSGPTPQGLSYLMKRGKNI